MKVKTMKNVNNKRFFNTSSEYVLQVFQITNQQGNAEEQNNELSRSFFEKIFLPGFEWISIKSIDHFFKE